MTRRNREPKSNCLGNRQIKPELGVGVGPDVNTTFLSDLHHTSSEYNILQLDIDAPSPATGTININVNSIPTGNPTLKNFRVKFRTGTEDPTWTWKIVLAILETHNANNDWQTYYVMFVSDQPRGS